MLQLVCILMLWAIVATCAKRTIVEFNHGHVLRMCEYPSCNSASSKMNDFIRGFCSDDEQA